MSTPALCAENAGPSVDGAASGIIGRSAAVQNALSLSMRAARSVAPVFLTGESGTGKELFAELVHRNSRRAAKPFVPINCAAIPHELIESELFGHRKGAFTGAIADHRGATLRANGGTLFLDEVCEMPRASQVKLLRFLQTGDVQRVGSGQLEKSDVRVVCATNLDPELEVQSGRFRSDLYYRLFVLPVALPRLSDRGSDVLLLARHFLSQFGEVEGRLFGSLSPEAEACLLSYAWPGNVRELQNIIRRMVVLHEGPVVSRDMLPANIAGADTVSQATEHSNVVPLHPERRTLCEIEREAITAAIADHKGSIPKAARTLGVSPSTIYRKLESWSASAAC